MNKGIKEPDTSGCMFIFLSAVALFWVIFVIVRLLMR